MDDLNMELTITRRRSFPSI